MEAPPTGRGFPDGNESQFIALTWSAPGQGHIEADSCYSTCPRAASMSLFPPSVLDKDLTKNRLKG